MADADNRPAWTGRKGFYEVWFATASDGRSGYWIRSTVHGGPEPHARVWFARFDREDPTRSFALNKGFPLERYAVEPEPFEVRIADVTFGGSRLHGMLEHEGRRVWWDLAYSPVGGTETYRLLPAAFYRGPMAPTKPFSPTPSASFTGSVTVDGERYDVGPMPGQQGHLYGREHARRWAWAHCPAFTGDGSEGVVVSALAAQGKRGPFTTPFLTSVGLRWRGQWIQLTSMSRTRQWSLGAWRLDLSNDRYRLTGRVAGDPKHLVQARYEDPSGEPRWCHNTEIGSSRFVLFERTDAGWDEAAVLSSEGTTHCEWAGTTPAPGDFVPHVAIE